MRYVAVWDMFTSFLCSAKHSTCLSQRTSNLMIFHHTVQNLATAANTQWNTCSCAICTPSSYVAVSSSSWKWQYLVAAWCTALFVSIQNDPVVQAECQDPAAAHPGILVPVDTAKKLNRGIPRGLRSWRCRGLKLDEESHVVFEGDMLEDIHILSVVQVPVDSWWLYIIYDIMIYIYIYICDYMCMYMYMNICTFAKKKYETKDTLFQNISGTSKMMSQKNKWEFRSIFTNLVIL